MEGQDPCLAPGAYKFGTHHWYRLPGDEPHRKETTTALEDGTGAGATLGSDVTTQAEDEDEDVDEEDEEEDEEDEPRYMQVAFKQQGTDIGGLGSSYRSCALCLQPRRVCTTMPRFSVSFLSVSVFVFVFVSLC